MSRFKEMPNSASQMWLIPPSLDEMLPSDCDVRLLGQVMDKLDWSRLEKSYAKTGRPAYPPRALGKILVYAYAKGVRSSRKIEELLEYDLRFMWLAGRLKPDFHTIARFRKDKFQELGELFVSGVRLCTAAGLVLMRAVAVDGTKIEANASKKSLYDGERIAKVREAVDKILREAEAVDEAEDAEYGEGNGRSLPDGLKDAEKRKAKIEEIAKQLKESGRKIVSSTDKESRMMKMGGRIRPGYNVQAAVDTEAQIIVAVGVTQSENDHGQLPDILEDVEANLGLSPDVVLADTGYSDEETLRAMDEAGQEALIPPTEHPRNKSNDLFSSRCFLPVEEKDAYICPAGRELSFSGEHKTGSGRYREYSAHGCKGCSFHKECVRKGRGSRRISVSVISELRDGMREKLKTPEGKEFYKLRMQTVEPAFGQIKANRQFGRFLLRGMEGARAEIALICLAHNLMKCVKVGAEALLHYLCRTIRWLRSMEVSFQLLLRQPGIRAVSF